ncbi:uncharacterized protein LOC106138857 [Amyelois transitella]|uniref:uncharacterized protein LOC106138857 n=1 Tax=Amyelois transitella TaxID=680683 RepID=UPI0029903C79|nr:uncharacterized protein LOC106138857 [Amyelois transitella]
MPKRRHRDKIEYYQQKLRRWEEKAERKNRRIIESSDSENSDNEPVIVEESTEINANSVDHHDTSSNPENEIQEPDPELDPEILSALGESTEESPKFGEKIHENLARLWTPILRKGLNKEIKDKFFKEYLTPENCTLLQAPKLNPEISAAVSDLTRSRDKRVESVQHHLGVGITALNRALTLLINNEGSKVTAIKLLSDSSRILCDLHYVETQARIKFITPGLDKAFLNIVQDINRDEMLFGNKLSEKIKASKVIEKQGLQIKKTVPNPKPATVPQPSSSRPRPQENWAGPPRQSSYRGGRGGARKTTSAGSTGRRAPPAPQSKSSTQTKQQRAAQQH